MTGSRRRSLAGADRRLARRERRRALRIRDGGGTGTSAGGSERGGAGERAAAAGGPPAAAAGGAGAGGARAARRPRPPLRALALAPGHRRAGRQPRAQGQGERRRGGGRLRLDAALDAAGGRRRAAALPEVAAPLAEAQRSRRRPAQPLRVAAPSGRRAPRQGGHTAGTLLVNPPIGSRFRFSFRQIGTKLKCHERQLINRMLFGSSIFKMADHRRTR